MVRHCSRLLVTLVLALVATAAVLTVAEARGVVARQTATTVTVSGIGKPTAGTASGEPDTPQGPQSPGSYPQGGISPPSPVDGSSDADGWMNVVRWISRIWAAWLPGAAH
jgi:hypothetical protein